MVLKLPVGKTDIDDTGTWVKYKKAFCEFCHGSCCTMPVEVTAEDLVRMRLIDEFDLQDKLKHIARKLIKKRLIEHFHSKSAIFTIARMANGDCIFLDNHSRRCTIYELRPDTCRNHPRVGPRPGYCAFRKK